MWPYLKLALVSGLLFTWTVGPAAATEGGADVQRWMAQARAQGMPGMAVVVTKGAQVLAADGVGTVDGRPINADTPFRIESLSKSFTATAVLQLVEEEKVDLDAPVTQYLTELRMADGRADEITVRQVLNQSSGLTDGSLGFDQYAKGPRTAEEAVDLVRHSTLAYDPGTEWSYSNPNYWIAARLVEVLTGETFSGYLDRHIFQPLGMSATENHDFYEREMGVQGHTFVFGEAVAVSPPSAYVSGAGGSVSTAADISRWLRFQHGFRVSGQHGAVLGRQLLEEMHRRQAPQDGLYALGWYSGPPADGGVPRTSHSGVGAGVGAYQGLFPDGVAVAVLQASSSPDPYRSADRLQVWAAGGPLTNPPAAPPPWRDIAAALIAAVVIGFAVRGIIRSRRWSLRGRRRWRIVRLLGVALLVTALVLVPTIGSHLLGRVATWPMLFTVAPAPVVSVLLSATALALLLVARAAHLGWSTHARAPTHEHQDHSAPVEHPRR